MASSHIEQWAVAASSATEFVSPTERVLLLLLLARRSFEWMGASVVSEAPDADDWPSLIPLDETALDDRDDTTSKSARRIFFLIFPRTIFWQQSVNTEIMQCSTVNVTFPMFVRERIF
jgi:hypothetical protein